MEALQGDGWSGSTTMYARIWMFVSFLLAFAGLLGSGWIMVARYVVPVRSSDPNDPPEGLPADTWPGVAVFLQNVIIFLSALLFRFGRAAGDSWAPL